MKISSKNKTSKSTSSPTKCATSAGPLASPKPTRTADNTTKRTANAMPAKGKKK